MSYVWKHAPVEMSKRLVELGVVLETERYWCKSKREDNCWYVHDGVIGAAERIPAPDVAELGRLLPFELGDDWALCLEKEEEDYLISYEGGGELLGNKIFLAPTEAQVRCAALIWLIENKRVKAEDLKLCSTVANKG